MPKAHRPTNQRMKQAKAAQAKMEQYLAEGRRVQSQGSCSQKPTACSTEVERATQLMTTLQTHFLHNRDEVLDNLRV
jgi:hypothetical protein